MKTIKAADLFCGAGGTSTGLVAACKALGCDVELMAINHWEIAVSTHSKNHPDARHLCASLDTLNPRELYREGELDLLWASPECTHHSVARGGKPINDQSRATAWCVVRWAEALRPKIIMVENVPEFRTWGAIDTRGKAMKSKKGATFLAWVEALKSLGYRVQWKVFCAADYGDPTTRKRLFVQAVRGRRAIEWPEPTHAKIPEAGFFDGGLKPWRGAEEIIDLNLPSSSIFKRNRPLSIKTLRRIDAGLWRFGFRKYIIQTDQHGSNGHCSRSLKKPLPAVVTKQNFALIEPYLVQVNHKGGKRTRSIKEPMATVCGNRGEWALAEPYLIELRGTNAKQLLSTSRSLKEPLSTVTGGIHHALAQPFLLSYYGNGEALNIREPLDTVTTKDRFALVQPTVVIDGEKYLLDIHLRMLQPHELAGAQGFPDGYKFAGNKTETVKQIGNAVPVNLAAALCTAVLQ